VAKRQSTKGQRSTKHTHKAKDRVTPTPFESFIIVCFADCKYEHTVVYTMYLFMFCLYVVRNI